MKIKTWLTKDRWIQGEVCENKEGTPLSFYEIECYLNPEIERACLLGAVHYCYQPDRIDEILTLILKEIGTIIEIWNDEPYRTWEDVYNLIERLDI